MSSSTKESYDFRRHVETIILKNGGIIFGGHVRDTILRDAHVNDYHIECIISNKDCNSRELFNDPTFHPELKGRLVTSRDIDCYMPAPAAKEMISDLHAASITTRVVFERNDAKKYLPELDIPYGILKHVRYMVYPVAKQPKRRSPFSIFCTSVQEAVEDIAPFHIDLLTARSSDFHLFYPPFGLIDFECNGLLMTTTGISMSPCMYPHLSALSRHHKIDVIIDDIRNMRAVYVDAESLTTRRIKKMAAKGWAIQRNFIKTCDSSDDVCIICHDDAPSYKLTCCNARYHRHCLVQAMCGDNEFCMERTMQCIMCKKYTRAFTEVTILKSDVV
jgi:hypothetical protein